MREQIQAAYDKGFGAEAIARMLKVDIVQVNDALDIVTTSNTVAKPDVSSIDNDSLRNMARATLATLIQDMQLSPSSFKPTEIIAACREALDRTEGKAAQSITVDAKQTVTHEYIMKLDPAEAYRRLMEVDIIDMGGDTAGLAAGVESWKAPTLTAPCSEDMFT